MKKNIISTYALDAILSVQQEVKKLCLSTALESANSDNFKLLNQYLQQNNQIEHLDISDNNLCGADLSIIFYSTKLPYLKFLNLSNNNIDNTELIVLAKIIVNFKKLEIVNLSNNFNNAFGAIKFLLMIQQFFDAKNFDNFINFQWGEYEPTEEESFFMEQVSEGKMHLLNSLIVPDEKEEDQESVNTSGTIN